MENKDEIVIFKNEEDEKVYVKVPEGILTNYQLQNLAGKVLQEDSHDKGLHDFDLAGLEEGNYFVIVEQDGIIRSKKIVIGYEP